MGCRTSAGAQSKGAESRQRISPIAALLHSRSVLAAGSRGVEHDASGAIEDNTTLCRR